MKTPKTDVANLTINITALITIVSLVWAAATWKAGVDNGMAQVQSQLGEINEHLVNLEHQ